MLEYNMKPFRFWCQKVLPLVYDDSLSYMELLCKVVNYLNHVIEDINGIPEYINQLISDDKLKEIMSELMNELREQIARANEGTNTTASYDRDKDELVWLNGKLVRMTRNILAGDRYVEDTGADDITGNYVFTSIEMELTSIKNALATEINNRQIAVANEVEAREQADTQLQNNIDGEEQAREQADTQLQNNIDAEEQAREQDISDLENIINNLDINHVYNQSSPTSGLTTNIGLKEGTYNITENTTINAQLVVPKGALLNISNGVTLTINGEILAGRYQIFSGEGSVSVDSKSQPFGYPEWFGAIANDSTDCTTPIQKCINAFKETRLTNGVYKITDTLKVTNAYKTLKGYGIWGGATVVKMYSTSNTILQLGPDSKPNEINAFPQDIRVENIEFTRNTSNWTNGSKGIDSRWILRSNLIDVMSAESSVPFFIQGCVYTKYIRCTAFSTTLSTGDTTRQYAGFRLTSSASIGAAGSNASIYILNCSSTTGGAIYDSSWGVQAFGTYGVSDLYIDKLESNGVAYGITVQGNNGRNSAHDIIITNCVIDAVKQTGIQVVNCAFGTVTVANNYMAIGANSATAFGIHVSACVNCTFSNNQIIGSVATVYGFYVENSIACNFIGNMIYECELSHYFENDQSCSIRDNIFNDATSSTQVVRLVSCLYCTVDCNARARGDYIVTLSATCQSCEVNATGLNRADITVGIIAINGQLPTANGYFNSNYISGFLAVPVTP